MRSKKIIFLLLCLILTGCKDKTYTVTFDTNGGSLMNSITLKEGENIENIDNPTKEGYLFVNWLKDGIEYNTDTPITKDITLTASWIETPELLRDYTVTLITDNVEEVITIKENSILKEPSHKKKENYTFIGWFLDDKEYDFNNKITKHIVLVAKYKRDMITITYELDNENETYSETIPKGSLLTIPNTPTKEGYKFLKWTLNDQEFSFSNKIYENITLKAIWEPIEYITITYDSDGGTEINKTIIEKYSQIKELPTPEKEGYIFKEWQLDNQTFDNYSKIDKDITLKAIYEKVIKGE